MFALTSIEGIGRRFANIVCKKADVDMNKKYLQFLPEVIIYFMNNIICWKIIIYKISIKNMTFFW